MVSISDTVKLVAIVSMATIGEGSADHRPSDSSSSGEPEKDPAQRGHIIRKLVLGIRHIV